MAREYTLRSRGSATGAAASNKLTDQSPMPFGIHKDKKMEDVPAKYLLWLRGDGCRNAPVRVYIEENLAALLKECPDYIP